MSAQEKLDKVRYSVRDICNHSVTNKTSHKSRMSAIGHSPTITITCKIT